MPSSFSRFLSDDELRKVRELYLESLEQEGMTPESEETEPAQQEEAASESSPKS
jgi:hypothetical protein